MRPAAAAILLSACALVACSPSIHDSVRMGDAKAVRDYLANGGSPNAVEARAPKSDRRLRGHFWAADGESLLHCAAAYGQGQIAELLLAAGALPDAKDSAGGSPLHTAASFGRKQVCEKLIASGASLNEGNLRGVTPLMLALIYGKVDVADLLIASGASASVTDNKGKSAVHYCIGREQTVIWAISHSLDLSAKDSLGLTPLHQAAQEGNYHGVVPALIRGGADVNARDLGGHTPLSHAMANQNLEVIEDLRAAGAVR